ncbi:hypothetical protein [Rhodospirillum sp. A1_3_36]|uniref:hypothetical protein n=1 Tax=Rhodospirillum sp. A1_3_36 TaxID=3391666 RepID=UPI0039A65DBB
MPTDSTQAAVLGGMALGAPTTDPATLAAQRSAAKEAARKADIATIKEKGFSTYVAELQEQKRQEMRDKILEAMGLDEDALEKMSPEERKAIETLISQEIQRRMTANSVINEQNNGADGKESQNDGKTGSFLSSTLAPNQDILRVLQEADQTALGNQHREKASEQKKSA